MSKRQLDRVRRICGTLPEVSERISHGAPTFFVRKKVCAMFVDNHHDDGHLAVWVPALPGFQETLTESDPTKYFRPPYVGGRGWIGIELGEITDDDLYAHIEQAWCMIAPKKLLAAFKEGDED